MWPRSTGTVVQSAAWRCFTSPAASPVRADRGLPRVRFDFPPAGGGVTAGSGRSSAPPAAPAAPRRARADSACHHAEALALRHRADVQERLAAISMNGGTLDELVSTLESVLQAPVAVRDERHHTQSSSRPAEGCRARGCRARELRRAQGQCADSGRRGTRCARRAAEVRAGRRRARWSARSAPTSVDS